MRSHEKITLTSKEAVWFGYIESGADDNVIYKPNTPEWIKQARILFKSGELDDFRKLLFEHGIYKKNKDGEYTLYDFD